MFLEGSFPPLTLQCKGHWTLAASTPRLTGPRIDDGSQRRTSPLTPIQEKSLETSGPQVQCVPSQKTGIAQGISTHAGHRLPPGDSQTHCCPCVADSTQQRKLHCFLESLLPFSQVAASSRCPLLDRSEQDGLDSGSSRATRRGQCPGCRERGSVTTARILGAQI